VESKQDWLGYLKIAGLGILLAGSECVNVNSEWFHDICFYYKLEL
jgi:hypothetical protein